MSFFGSPMSERIPDSVVRAAAQLGVHVDTAQSAQLASYVQLLLEANKRTNLTAVREPEEAYRRHILDSLSLLPELERVGAGTVIDVGSGGGLPGLVLAIMRPMAGFTLVDATGKKVRHVEGFIEALGLSNARALQARAEELASADHPGQAMERHRERYDVAVTRALAPMRVLLELVSPFVRPGGLLLAIKGERAEWELTEAHNALSLLHCEVRSCQRTETGTIVGLDKLSATPRRFPRRTGEPKRAPL